MSIFNKLLDAIRLNDDYDEEDEDFLDEEDVEEEFEEEESFDDDDDAEEDFLDKEEEEKPKFRFFRKMKKSTDEEEDFEDPTPAKSVEPVAKTSKFSASKPEKKEPAAEPVKEKEPFTFTKSKAAPVSSVKPGTSSSKVTPMRKKGNSLSNMEVVVIKPASMEDTREIADSLHAEHTVILNLEGVDVDVAQRIIDFCCGSTYMISGSIQKVSSFIFILTPSGVEISGDYQDILSGAFDLPSMRMDY